MDIIILIFLAIKIGRLAELKGLSSLRWRTYFVIAWISGEIIGGYIGMMIFGFDNTVSWALVGLAGAFTAYFILRNYLNRLPDNFGDDIENIG